MVRLTYIHLLTPRERKKIELRWYSFWFHNFT